MTQPSYSVGLGLFLYNNTMKFARLLLESYSKLHEQQQDVMSFLTSKAPQWDPNSGIPRPQSIPVESPGNPGAEPVLVGVNQKGEIKIEGGPLGTQIVNANKGAKPNALAKLEAWYMGEEEGGEQGTTEQVDPILSRLSEPDQARLEQLEQSFPGITEKFKSILESSNGLVEDGIMSEAEVLQRILGGASRGSLAWNLQKELEGGSVKFERTDSIGFALDDIDILDLSGSIDMMDKLGKAYAKSRRCEYDADTMRDVSNLIRKDPKRNSYFFASPLDGKRFGVSLSVADLNPINLMANEYNKNLTEICGDKVEDGEQYLIKDKEIRANYSDNPGNISNIVKESSEMIQIAAFYAVTGDRVKASEIITDLVSRFGAQAFNVLNMKKMVEAGEHVLDEKYQEMLESMESLGINLASDVEAAVRGPLKTYMMQSMKFTQELNPDYAARVGGVAGKGDKSDVDYVLRERPEMSLPEGTVLKVKFENLAPEVQKTIKESGDEIQDDYWLVGDSLKTYINEGEVKLGTANNTGGEAARLIKDGDSHGDFIWSQLGVSDKDKSAAKQVLSKMKQASDSVSKLMTKDFKTGSMGVKQARSFVRKQVQEMLSQAGITGEEKRIIKAAMDMYENEGPSGGKKAAGLIDREVQRLILEQGIKRKSNGKVDKNKSRGSLVAFAALQASMGMDSTGKNPMSSIHILSTGRTIRENQNSMILEPLKDLLDPDSPRGLNIGASKWTVDRDGSTEFKAGKGKSEGNSYINTRYLK